MWKRAEILDGLTFHALWRQLRPGELVDQYLRPAGLSREKLPAFEDDLLPDRVLTRLEWHGALKKSAAATKQALREQFEADPRAFLARLNHAERIADLLDDEARSAEGAPHRRWCHGYTQPSGQGERLIGLPWLAYRYRPEGQQYRALPPDPKKFADLLYQLPEGQRFVRTVDFHFAFPERFTPKDKNPGYRDGFIHDGQSPGALAINGRRFPGVFFGRWQAAIVPVWREFFAALKAEGMTVNGLVLDWETSLGMYHLQKQRDEQGQPGIFEWLLAHPDWPPLAERYQIDLRAWRTWSGNSPAGLRFTEAMHQHTAEQMQILFDIPREIFGDDFWLGCNFSNFIKCATYQSSNEQDYYHGSAGEGAILGNYQSCAAYNSMNETWEPGVVRSAKTPPSYQKASDGKKTADAWDRFLYDQFTLRRAAAASRVPLALHACDLEYAWANRGFSDDEKLLYVETLFSAACLGADPFLFWDSTHGKSPPSNDLWERVLAEIERVFVSGPAVPLTPERITWEERLAAVSTTDVGGRLISRFTPHPAQRAQFGRRQQGDVLVLHHKPSQRQWTFPRGQMLSGADSASRLGWWIVQPNRAPAERDLWNAARTAAAWEVLMPGLSPKPEDNDSRDANRNPARPATE